MKATRPFAMPILTCPRCGTRGETRGGDSCFEDIWPEVRGHLPVRRCSDCGAGIIVSTKLLALGVRANLIPDDIWLRMEDESFGRARQPASLARSPSARRSW